MSFLYRLRMALARFMMGRNGVDTLGYITLWSGLILQLFAPYNSVLSLLGLALYALTVFRMLSRNVAKRQKENAWVEGKVREIKKSCTQLSLRWKNRKIYKYANCPGCKKLLRVKRTGEVREIACPECHHRFSVKT